MLTPFDEYPIHQVPKPIAVSGTTDKNAYGRYWFGASHRDGAFQIEAAFGRYQNLGVLDSSISIAINGAQHSFHASRRAPLDPTDLTVGPVRLEITEPFRQLRLVVEPNDTGISCDMRWRARVGALLEDHTLMMDGVSTVLDMARFMQFGTWEGTFVVDGEVTEFTHDEVVGIRDRSWGVRPVGVQGAGRPSQGPPNAWLWSPIHFDDECIVAGWFQRPGGAFWRPDGHRIAVVDPVPQSVSIESGEVARLDPVGQRLSFHRGTRWVSSASIDLVGADGVPVVLELEPLARFDMRALGYMNPEWGHGMWHGELEIAREDWTFSEISPQDPTHQHIHHLCRARLGDKVGVGIFEQIIFGPHTQFGFSDILDGAE
ncbi:MAG: hypothetical protein F2520_02015 [Actinobacteria bacterium]|uniref:Unannotated protein n=1 Tax=freshwater metagenome TaxID=449393 RepID=A0A6J7I2H6_9ZZZZ|nr:hypothetical protein [Actinomycetota bacterium]MTA77020.1 hypothetical protein [Actinomycetota bacterium]